MTRILRGVLLSLVLSMLCISNVDAAAKADVSNLKKIRTTGAGHFAIYYTTKDGDTDAVEPAELLKIELALEKAWDAYEPLYDLPSSIFFPNVTVYVHAIGGFGGYVDEPAVIHLNKSIKVQKSWDFLAFHELAHLVQHEMFGVDGHSELKGKNEWLFESSANAMAMIGGEFDAKLLKWLGSGFWQDVILENRGIDYETRAEPENRAYDRFGFWLGIHELDENANLIGSIFNKIKGQTIGELNVYKAINEVTGDFPQDLSRVYTRQLAVAKRIDGNSSSPAEGSIELFYTTGNLGSKLNGDWLKYNAEPNTTTVINSYIHYAPGPTTFGTGRDDLKFEGFVYNEHYVEGPPNVVGSQGDGLFLEIPRLSVKYLQVQRPLGTEGQNTPFYIDIVRAGPNVNDIRVGQIEMGNDNKIRRHDFAAGESDGDAGNLEIEGVFIDEPGSEEIDFEILSFTNAHAPENASPSSVNVRMAVTPVFRSEYDGEAHFEYSGDSIISLGESAVVRVTLSDTADVEDNRNDIHSSKRTLLVDLTSLQAPGASGSADVSRLVSFKNSNYPEYEISFLPFQKLRHGDRNKLRVSVNNLWDRGLPNKLEIPVSVVNPPVMNTALVFQKDGVCVYEGSFDTPNIETWTRKQNIVENELAGPKFGMHLDFTDPMNDPFSIDIQVKAPDGAIYAADTVGNDSTEDQWEGIWLATFELPSSAISGEYQLMVDGKNIDGYQLDADPASVAHDILGAVFNYEKGRDKSHTFRVDAQFDVTNSEIVRGDTGQFGEIGTTKNGWFTTTDLIWTGNVSDTLAYPDSFVSGLDFICVLRAGSSDSVFGDFETDTDRKEGKFSVFLETIVDQGENTYVFIAADKAGNEYQETVVL